MTDAEIEALVNNQTAKVTSISGPETLADGENIYTIVVTAENGNEKVYTVKVIREASEKEKVEEPVANVVNYVNDDTNEPEPVVTNPTKPATDSTDTKVDNTDTDTPKEKIARLTKALENSRTAADEAKSAYDNLTSAFGAYDDAIKKTDELTAGTNEYAAALAEANA